MIYIISQLLGITLLGLSMLAPIQQQNIPNIYINVNGYTNTVNENQFYVVVPHTSYDVYSATSIYKRADISAVTTSYEEVYIQDDNFYVTTTPGSGVTTGTILASLIRKYYFDSRGGNPTSESFDFTVNSLSLATTSTYYTYSLNGAQGTMTGRVYYTTLANIDTNQVISANLSVTIPITGNIQTLVNAVNPQISLENTTLNNKIIYYFISGTLYKDQPANYTRTLYAKTNYGRVITIGNININMIYDTTSPTITSITGNSTNWTNQNIILTVNATDNQSLSSTAYSFDNGVTYQASNQSTFTTNQNVQIKVRDTSGNITSQEVLINRIDKQAPSVNLAGNWKNTFELGELISNNDLYNYLSISDVLSGINSSLTSISNFNYNQAGAYSNVQVSATDNAGNNTVYTLPTVTVTQPADTTGPIITGPSTVNVIQGNITTQSILDLYTVTDISGVDIIQIRDLNNNIITSWTGYTQGSYQLRIYARDTLNNITQYQFTLQVGQAPPPDLTPPQIIGPLLVSFEIGTYTSNQEILNLYTYQDNVAILQTQLIGTIDYQILGDYQVTIRATDTSNNVTNKIVTIRIRDEQVLGNYNPLTDLLSGIFGGALSMIFTIGTIEVLGLRLLDAMGVIILGAVLLFVYKAIKGGS